MKSTLLAFALLMTSAVFAQEKIHWMSLEQAEKANQEEPRKVIIDVYTDWCGWCKRMDQTTFANPVIAKYANEHFYMVKFNAEQKDSITFKGHTFKYVAQGRRGFNQLAVALLNGKLVFPNLVYMNKDLEIIQPIPGYQDATTFEQIIHFIGEDKYKEMSFEDFKKDFTSEL